MSLVRNRLVLAASAIVLVSGGFLVQQAVASPAPLPQHPLMHFLGLDNPAVMQRIKAAQEQRGQAYLASVNGCMAHHSGPTAHADCNRIANSNMSALLSAGDIYDRLETQMYTTLAAMPAVMAVGHAWWVCMGSPSAFTDPPSMINNLSKKAAAGSNVSQEWAAMTTQDTQCQHDAVDPVFQPLLRRAEAQLVRSHPAELTALRQALGGS
jgi:hypothetical protein